MYRHYATAFEEDLVSAAHRFTEALLGAGREKLGATVGATGTEGRGKRVTPS
jgi:hypothetical protein